VIRRGPDTDLKRWGLKLASHGRHEKPRTQKKGTDNAEYRTAGYLHPHHRENRRFPEGGRPPVDQAVERRERGRVDHAPAAPQRHALFRHQHLDVWASAVEQGFASPSWMTFRQALELNANVRKGEKGSLVVYANSVTKTEQNDAGEDVERYPLPERLHLMVSSP